MTPSERLTESEMFAASQVTGIPLLYIMKLDAYNMIDRRAMLEEIIRQEYIEIRKETGASKKKISKSISRHHKAPHTWVFKIITSIKGY